MRKPRKNCPVKDVCIQSVMDCECPIENKIENKEE